MTYNEFKNELETVGAVTVKGRTLHSKQTYKAIPEGAIKAHIQGMSGGLVVAINEYSKDDSSLVYFLAFKTAEIKTDSVLRALLYGRVNARGACKMALTASALLLEWYSNHAIAIALPAMLDELDINRGIGAEKYLETRGYKRAGKKWDAHGVDVIGPDGSKWQVKCSIYGLTGAGSTTNKVVACQKQQATPPN